MSGLGLGTVNAIRPVMKRLTADNLICNPESLRRITFINIPAIFSIIYSIISSMINERSKARVKPIADPAQWKPLLMQDCESSLLVTIEEMRQTGADDGAGLKPGKAVVALRPGTTPWSKGEVTVVLDSGDTLKWALKPSQHGCAFRACIYAEDGTRVAFKEVPDIGAGEEGEFQTTTREIVTLIMDNGASWMSTCHVDYNIEVVKK